MLPSEIWKGKVVAGPNGCNLWTGCLTSTGYGSLQKDGKTRYAHRVIYEEFFGQIPPRKLICHKCNVRRCVNPLHLYAGTNSENMRDRRDAGYRISEETREKIRSSNLGRKFSEEHCRKIAASKAGRRISDSHRQALLLANTGRSPSAETRAKISASNLGKKLSDEHRAKISAAKRAANAARKSFKPFSTFNGQ